MITKARATVTDASVAIAIAPAGDVVVLDCWALMPPDVHGVRALKVEPKRWWIIDGGAAIAAIAQRLGDDGALTPIGGGLLRARLTGPGWRAQLMIGGVFDAEDGGFGPGDCAATIIHHVPVWIDVIADAEAHVYFAASHRADIERLWRLAPAA